MTVTVDQLLTAVRDRVAGLGLTLGVDPLTVVVRKDAKRQSYEPTRLVVVSKKPGPEGRGRFASGADITRHAVRVTVLTPGNDDHSANLGVYASWRDAITTLFRTRASANLGLPDLRDVRATPGEFLPAEGIDTGYDAQTIDVTIEVISTR